jgi:hypothetical protein
MPILLPPDHASPLDQGDVLADIETHRTRTDGSPNPTSRRFVLVLSRPCNSLRDDHVVVAPVEPGRIPQIKEPQTPEELLRVFERIRDGEGAPDRFYLGAATPGDSNRYVAKLDELYTIEVPKKPDERAQFLERHRRFRLDPSFARDLHVRVFRAFASLGFDDVAWWSDGDLELVVNQCDAWVRKIESEIETLRQGADPRRDVLAASGEPGKAIHRLDEEIKSAEKRKREILAQYERERRELERRRSARG